MKNITNKCPPNFSASYPHRHAIGAFCLLIILLCLFGLAGCGNKKYDLTYTAETPIYNEDSFIGYSVTAKIKINDYQNAGDIRIPSTKLLYHIYETLPIEGSTYPTKDYVVYYYGKVYRMEINLSDRSYPIRDRYVSYDESPDYCAINIGSYLPNEFELTIFYILDEKLNKKLDLSTYEWV